MSTFSTDICTRLANTSLTDADAAGGASMDDEDHEG